MTELLGIHGLSLAFSGLRALQAVSFEVAEETIVGLIGPNGAGKSTLLNCVSRLYLPNRGEVVYRGRSLLDHRVHEIAGLGIRRTFQNLELFREATVRENVVLGGASRHRAGLVADLLGLPRSRRERREAAREADRLLVELGLAEHAEMPVAGLPYGIQKGVELARALASGPRLLLLDEPAAGMSPEESRRLGQTIRALREARGITVLLVEHDMRLVMEICDRVVALDHGEKISEGTPADVRSDPTVVRAYLGEETESA